MAQTPGWQKHNSVLFPKMGAPSAGDPPNRRGDEDDGLAPSRPEPARGSQQGREWGKDWESWGRRVRRDILVIEAFLKARYPAGSTNPFDPYGDPGDPPPPPDEEFIP